MPHATGPAAAKSVLLNVIGYNVKVMRIATGEETEEFTLKGLRAPRLVGREGREGSRGERHPPF
jgi:hypothetical protein